MLMFNEVIDYGIDPFIEDGFTEPISKIQKGESLNSQRLIAYENLQKRPNATLFEMTTENFVKNHSDEIPNLNISFVVIDGSHYFEDIVIDYNLAMNCLGHRPGIILWDDFQITYVQQAFEKFQSDHKNRILKIESINWRCKYSLIRAS
ncbi:MAG: hypothetical protein EBV10_01375 [Synechococcaceae bacterium WB6_1A_059]|nr:hypothetical protein [Synechococcaceae bacterium WB6_1A_059]